MKSTMKAIVVKNHGGPEVLTPEEVARPEPAMGQALIKIRACALNHLDVWVRKGIPGVKLPLIPGCDIAGQVEQLGPGVSNLKPGEAVMVCPGLSCRTCKYCLDGKENLCRFYKIIGEHCDGGYAEYISVDAVNCFPVPDGLNFHQAAALPLVFLTAWHMLVARVGMQLGETVLVIGGGSGVGSAAIQIAKLFRCRVITTVGSEQKAEAARRLGADEVINHSKQSIADEVARITGKQGVDIIFEHVGPAVWKDCMSSLAKNGRLVTCGATTGPKVEIELPRLFMKHQSIFGSVMGTRKELADMMPFFNQGLLKPVVHKVLPLSQARQAQELLESRDLYGKVVLDPLG